MYDFNIFKTSVEINFEKLLGHSVFKNHQIKIISNHFNLLQVCPSVLSFGFAVLFISPLNFVTIIFTVSLNLVVVTIASILINFVTLFGD